MYFDPVIVIRKIFVLPYKSGRLGPSILLIERSSQENKCPPRRATNLPWQSRNRPESGGELHRSLGFTGEQERDLEIKDPTLPSRLQTCRKHHTNDGGRLETTSSLRLSRASGARLIVSWMRVIRSLRRYCPRAMMASVYRVRKHSTRRYDTCPIEHVPRAVNHHTPILETVFCRVGFRQVFSVVMHQNLSRSRG